MVVVQIINMSFRMFFHFFIMDSFISFVLPKWSNECFGSVEKENKQEKGKVEKCRNPNLGLATKARACKNASQVWRLGVTFHAPRNVGECERMNPHTPKWVPTLGVGIPMDFWIFVEPLQRSKFIGSKTSLYHWKALKTYMSKMGLHDPFGHLKHKLWPKKGLKVKLTIWLPTTKSRELTQFHYVQVLCHIAFERSWQGLKLFFRLHLNQRSIHKVMEPQSCKSPNFGNFRTSIWQSRDKMTFRC
jgi:hypothetical protein